jgi:hypothetical protein
MHGGPASVSGPHLVADNGTIHDELIGVFDGVFRNQVQYPMVQIVS